MEQISVHSRRAAAEEWCFRFTQCIAMDPCARAAWRRLCDAGLRNLALVCFYSAAHGQADVNCYARQKRAAMPALRAADRARRIEAARTHDPRAKLFADRRFDAEETALERLGWIEPDGSAKTIATALPPERRAHAVADAADVVRRHGANLALLPLKAAANLAGVRLSSAELARLLELGGARRVAPSALRRFFALPYIRTALAAAADMLLGRAVPPNGSDPPSNSDRVHAARR